MILSPRSLARQPLAFGLVLFALFLIVGALLYSSHLRSSQEGQQQLLEQDRQRSAELQQRKTAEWHARGGDSRPLCDDSEPTNEADLAEWVAFVDCLEERRRDPALQLEGVRAALRFQSSERLEIRRAELLSELGKDSLALTHLRRLHRTVGDDHRAQVARELARAILFTGDADWSERRAEAQELLGTVGGPDCESGALRVLAAWPVESEISMAAQSYGDCAARTSSGELDSLMEIIAVGAAAAEAEGVPDVVTDGPKEIARNFKIKSTFAMCAEAVPDATDLRARCERVLAAER